MRIVSRRNLKLLTTRLARDLPNAKLIMMLSCGHVPQEECPEQFLHAVTDFLSALPEETTWNG
jgi:pimeloyl-ACP methyl ester carboxylesterase